MKIIFTNKFIKQYKKLPSDVCILFEKKEKVFRENPFDASLRTHKLSGKLDGCYSFSINYKYRIVFTYNTSKNLVEFLAIGNHDIYD